MSREETFKRIENLHIIFWLIKDTCWMLELKWLGACMIFPTLGLAVYFIVKTFRTSEAFLHGSIFFWVLANSYWMIREFFYEGSQKELATIPFGIGILTVSVFYWKNYLSRKKSNLL